MEKKVTVQNEKKRQKIEEEGINGLEREIWWQQQLRIVPALKYEK